MSTTPKQPQAEILRDWYPYYAGFTESFVARVIREYLNDASSVIDPWNGSGTTTAVCEAKGIRAVGVDINPALTIIARARLTPLTIAKSLPPLGARLVATAKDQVVEYHDQDLLTTWMRPDAVRRVRSLEFAIRRYFDASQEEDSLPRRGFGLGTSPSLLSCFYYTALFAAIRDILRRFRSSNPTWQRPPASPFRRVAPSWARLERHFLERVDYFSQRLGTGALFSSEDDDLVQGRFQHSMEASLFGRIRTGTATSLPESDGEFDACITSPPYATRIDYVKSTLPELAILGSSSWELEVLRRSTTGSPIVKKTTDTQTPLCSPTGLRLLQYIKSHPSKGSRTYYFPWMSHYLQGLQQGLAEAARVVKKGGTLCVVVQNSYYKERLVDLQAIVGEIFEAEGRSLGYREDHRVSHNLALLNPNARRNVKQRRNIESLLIFA